MCTAPSSSLKTCVGSLFLPPVSVKEYHPSKFLPLSNGIQPSSAEMDEGSTITAVAKVATIAHVTKIKRGDFIFASFVIHEYPALRYAFDGGVGSSQPTYSCRIRLPWYSNSSWIPI